MSAPTSSIPAIPSETTTEQPTGDAAAPESTAVATAQSTLADAAEALRELRSSKSYKLINLLSAARRHPGGTLVNASRWAVERTRGRDVGLMGMLEAPDPLRPVETQLGGMAASGMLSAPSPWAAPRGSGHLAVFCPDAASPETVERWCSLAQALARRLYRVTLVFSGAPSKTLMQRASAAGIEPLLLDRVTPAIVAGRGASDSTWIFASASPHLLPYLRWASAHRLLTHLDLSEAPADPGSGAEGQPAVLEEFVRLAQRHSAASAPLLQLLAQRGAASPLLLPNAADDSVFAPYRKIERPRELLDSPGRYFLCHTPPRAEWMDWAPIMCAAEANSDATFVVLDERRGQTAAPPNLRFLGRRTPEERQRLIAHSEALLVSLSSQVPTGTPIPTAVYEQLAFDKPVFCSGLGEEIPEATRLRRVGSPAQLAELCARLPEHSGEPYSFVSRNTWHHRAEALLDLPIPSERFSFVILLHNNRPIIERCLSTLLANTAGFDREVIVVDNASTDGGDRLVEEKFPEVRLLRNPQNGCSSGRNLGCRSASGDCLVFFDSDTWFTSCGFLHETSQLLRQNPGLGALGWSAGWFDLSLEHLGGPIADFLPRRAVNQEVEQRGFRTDIGFLSTCGMFVKRSVWEQLEGFDERFDPTCFEDTDLSFQILDHGYEVGFRDLVGICHQPHQTTAASAANPSYMSLFARNSDYFRKKWAHRPEYFRQLQPSR